MVLLNTGISSPGDGLVSAAPFIIDMLTPTNDECTFDENGSSIECDNQDCYPGSSQK